MDNEYCWTYDLSSTNPLFFILDEYIRTFGEFDINNLPLSAFEDEFQRDVLNIENINILNEKYLSNNIFWTSGGTCEPFRENLELPIARGNNFFYYPSGECVLDILESPNKQFRDSLSALNFLDAGATPGSSCDIADTIWSIRGKEVSGAWLKSFDNERVTDTTNIKIVNGKNIFKFPYAGMGLSGEGIDWTGKSIDNVQQDIVGYSNKQEIRNAIDIRYWNDSESISSVDPIYLQKTTLIDDGAFDSKNFFLADKIRVRDECFDDSRNGIYSGEEKVAWLYDYTNTEIPIEEGENNIYFPLHKYDNADDIPFEIRLDQISPIRLRDLNIDYFCGAIAGSNPDIADKVFKKQSACGEPTEGAWLKGCDLKDVNTDVISGVQQNGIHILFESNEIVKFLWSGPDVAANEIFNGYEHESYCEYPNLEDYPNYIENSARLDKDIDYNAWKNCNCKAVYYSPIGHNKFGSINDIELYRNYADILAVDYSFTRPFTFNEWRDLDGRRYFESANFAFAQYDGFEGDSGWGVVDWRTGDGSEFILRCGQTYLYRRAPLNGCGDVPSFVLNKCFCDLDEGCYNPVSDKICKPEWNKLVQNADGEWIDSGQISDMVIRATDFLTYEHLETTNVMMSSIVIDSITTSSNTITSISAPLSCTEFEFVSSVVLSSETTLFDVVSCFDGFDLSGNSAEFCLVLSSYELSADTRWITDPNLEVIENTTPSGVLSFPVSEVSCISLSSTSSIILSSTDTIVLDVVSSLEVIELETKNPNFVINIDLENYNPLPYWAAGVETKGLYASNLPVTAGDYLCLAQPSASDIFLENDQYFCYERCDCKPFIWKQELDFSLNLPIDPVWKHIHVNYVDSSLLSKINNTLNCINFTPNAIYLDEFTKVLNFSATNLDSSMLLETFYDCDNLTQVYYNAKSSFTWRPNLTTVFGDNNVPVSSGVYLRANEPWENRNNLKNVTVASKENKDNLKTKDELGLLSNAGLNTFAGIGQTNSIRRKECE